MNTAMSFLPLALIAAGTLMAAGAYSAEPAGSRLSPKLRALLQQEMRQVLHAHQQILAAVAMGDHAAVAEQAQKIHDSFILEQSLTPEDKEALEKAAPAGFVDLDRSFHELAQGLAQAASAKDVQQELEYFNDMSRACVECHSRFVTDRFPGVE